MTVMVEANRVRVLKMEEMGSKMNEAEKYAVQWDVSAQYFYEKSYYL